MAELDDERPSQDGDPVFDEELLDDYAPTRVSLDTRALALAAERSFRPDHVRVGDLLARKYRVERVHRRGALGITVEALHTQLGQRVAIRLLAADPRAYPEAAARFLRGARLAVQYQNQHTARITDVGTLESGSPYIVAEFLAGSDLQRVLRVREWLAVPEAVDYLLQACEGLSDAHAHDVVHRNLKPTNLFLTRRGGVHRLVVLDFGVSEDPLTDAAINLGGISSAGKSLAYLAPEQIREPASVDARADIWALGAILHEMLTGCALFDAHTTPGLLAMIAADPPVPVSHLRPEIPAELESIVLRCLAKDREARFASVAELAGALGPFASADGHESVERLSKTLGRRARSTRPPPLPGHSPTRVPTRAIVRVPQPPKTAASPTLATAPAARRFVELGLTALGLAAAGALGVYVAIHSMEGALAAAMAPRAVVADLSPALPAAVAPRVELEPSARGAAPPLVVAPLTPAPVQALPKPVPAVAFSRPLAVAQPARMPAPRHSPPKAALSEDAVVADAKPASRAPGLFDDAN